MMLKFRGRRIVLGLFLIAVFGHLALYGQTSLATSTLAQTPSDYSIVEMRPHSRIWRNSAGQSVEEIGTGMNFWDGNQWSPSDPSFVVSQDGKSFVAEHLQDPVRIAANLNVVGAVTTVTPTGVTLKSTPIAIGLFDPISGKSVVVATLTNAVGVLADPQHVVYSNAFVGGGFTASVVYSLPDTGSFHQDIVFTEFDRSFDPTTWGFAADAVNKIQIQIFTEFYSVPQPNLVTNNVYIENDPAVRAKMTSPDLVDYAVDWGDYVLWPGKVFTKNRTDSGTRILKDFVTSDGRTFLVESVPYSWMSAMLADLPPPVAKNTRGRRPQAARLRIAAAEVPPIRQTPRESSQRIIPRNKTTPVSLPKGVDVDYIATVSSSSSPVVYAADTTYYVSSTIYDYAPVTLESAVFKFPPGAGIIYIYNNGQITLGTGNYRPAIFTAADDNTAGTALSTNIWSGYTGNPGTNRYGTTGLWLYAATNVTVNNLQFRYQYNGIAGGYASTNQVITVSHCQFVYGDNGVIFEPNSPLKLNFNNCLFADVQYPAQSHSLPVTVNACNCTFDGVIDLFYADGTWSGTASYNLTNSILSNVTNEWVVSSSSAFVTNAAYNGFYNATPVGTSYLSSSASPYAAAGAGNYYLPSSSPFLTAGTSNINSSLLSQLQMKTTEPPLTLTNLIAEYTALNPQAQRDTAGSALGFHYDPIDFIFGCSISNATLVLTNGVAIAYYDNLGICLTSGSQLFSQGTPISRNYLVYYGLVQEQPVNLWTTNTAVAQSEPIVPVQGSALNSSIFLRLTTICAPQGETNLMTTADTRTTVSGLTLRDCEVYGAGASWIGMEATNTPVFGFTNNVFHRVPFAVSNSATVAIVNNLFYGTTNANEFAVSILNTSGTSPNTHINNVYDGVKAVTDGYSHFNAYLHGATNMNIGGPLTHEIFTNIIWQAGPLGSYYQTATSPLLNNGANTAGALGLYHYTVCTNDVIDGSNQVSRGYHYVALGSNGLPLDTNGDGIPDYLEDANGNGVVDSGEIGWNIFGDLGLSVIITQPANNSTIP